VATAFLEGFPKLEELALMARSHSFARGRFWQMLSPASHTRAEAEAASTRLRPACLAA